MIFLMSDSPLLSSRILSVSAVLVIKHVLSFQDAHRLILRIWSGKITTSTSVVFVQVIEVISAQEFCFSVFGSVRVASGWRVEKVEKKELDCAGW